MGYSIPLPKDTESGIPLLAVFERRDAFYASRGWADSSPLFPSARGKGEALKTATALMDDLLSVYVPAAEAAGLRIPAHFRISSHSFRRGGINALLRAAREAGFRGWELESLIMRYGRWRDPATIRKYIFESDPAVAGIAAGM